MVWFNGVRASNRSRNGAAAKSAIVIYEATIWTTILARPNVRPYKKVAMTKNKMRNMSHVGLAGLKCEKKLSIVVGLPSWAMKKLFDLLKFLQKLFGFLGELFWNFDYDREKMVATIFAVVQFRYASSP